MKILFETVTATCGPAPSQATSPLTVRTHSTEMDAHTTTPHTHDHHVKSPSRKRQPRQTLSLPHRPARTRSPSPTGSPTARLPHRYRRLQTLVGGSWFYSRTRSNSGPRLRPTCCSGAARRPTPRGYPKGKLLPSSVRGLSRARAGPHTHPQPEENTPTRRLQLQPPGPSKAEPLARAHSSAHAEHTCMSGRTETSR